MPEGGQLTIETSNASIEDTSIGTDSEFKCGDYVVIAVSDNGSGMPQEVIERAFDPFFTTKELGQGTGLGLSQVYGFVKQSGGHVSLYSEVGQGTTVKIYLPRYIGAQEASVQRFEAKSDTGYRAKKGETILVVEDDEQVREMSTHALRELGYEVLQARDGNQALDIIGSQARVDLVFADVVLPGMSGPKLAGLARGQVAAIKVLYTTGYAPNSILRNGMVEKGIAILEKPFTIAELAKRVREALAQHPR